MKGNVSALLLLAAVAMVCSCVTLAGATTPRVPADSPEDMPISMSVMNSQDEAMVYDHLSDQRRAVRLAAALRLHDIGSSYSLDKPALKNAALKDPDQEVRAAAAFSWCAIYYRVAAKKGPSDAEDALIRIISGADLEKEIKTPEAKVWAIEKLADMGSAKAVRYLDHIIGAHKENAAVKDAARAAVAIIGYVNPSKMSAADVKFSDSLIGSASADKDIAIRRWAARAMAALGNKRGRPMLEKALKDAQAHDDQAYASYIDTLLYMMKDEPPALEITVPEDGVTVKTPEVVVRGSSFGEPFSEVYKLRPGENTYTKTVKGPDGTETTKKLKIYYVDERPLLEAIGQREATVGKELVVTISAKDADDEDLYYYGIDLPEGAVFDREKRSLVWTPQKAGTYRATLGAADPYGLRDEEQVTITVSEAAPAS